MTKNIPNSVSMLTTDSAYTDSSDDFSFMKGKLKCKTCTKISSCLNIILCLVFNKRVRYML